MKTIAIPVLDNKLSPHFGHAPYFLIYETENNTITKQRMEKTPPHTPGAIPAHLKKIGVSDVIVSGIGQKAVDIFNASGINVFSGAQTDTPANIIQNFLENKLVLTENTCDNDHHGNETHTHNCKS